MINSRRSFLKMMGGATAFGAFSGCATHEPRSGAGHIVVVGGGFGGAACAKYIRYFDPAVQVTLVDANLSHYFTCPFSNLVLSGDLTIDTLKVNFDTLKNKHGVKLIEDHVEAVDADARTVRLKSGKILSYDRLVLSPGIHLNYEKISGYSQALSEKLPHAWKAGEQTMLLRKQIEAMPDGGTFLMVAPPNPFRCPPGPYERASMVASYFKRHKPKSKIIILDPKKDFSKQALFVEAWDKLYPGMIEWIGEGDGGAVASIDASTMTAVTKGGEKFKADVMNVIPPMQAGKIITMSGLADEKGWAPVNLRSFESTQAEHIYVIGDSCIAGPVPKSGFSANSQAKVAAFAIVQSLKGGALPKPSIVNTCYSYLSERDAISVTAIFDFNADNQFVPAPGSPSVSAKGGKDWILEGVYGKNWYEGIRKDTWG